MLWAVRQWYLHMQSKRQIPEAPVNPAVISALLSHIAKVTLEPADAALLPSALGLAIVEFAEHTLI